MWARPPHKKALDQMWYAGTLATCHRENFVKFYDLGERVLGPIDTGASDLYREHALHARALAHLPFTTHGEVARFWDLARPAEARAWTDAHTIPVEIEGADGSIHASRAAPDIETRLATEPPLSNRLRIINPFDPAIRDRARAEQARHWFMEDLRAGLLARLDRDPDIREQIEKLGAEVAQGEKSPTVAADEVLSALEK